MVFYQFWGNSSVLEYFSLAAQIMNEIRKSVSSFAIFCGPQKRVDFPYNLRSHAVLGDSSKSCNFISMAK